VETRKTLTAFTRRADEGILPRMLVETSILLTASWSNPNTVLRNAAITYKVHTDAIALKEKHEFVAKRKGEKEARARDQNVKKAA